MNGQPRINGTTTELRVPIFGDWQPIRLGGLLAEPTPTPESVADPTPAPANPAPVAVEAPRTDPVAEAEAEAIRARAAAETEALRIAAEAEAEAIRIKAADEAERQRIANQRAAMRLEKERADHDLRLAETRRKREETERQRLAAERAATNTRQEEAEQAEAIKTADEKWRQYAIRFAIVCGIVALPVQINAFWNPAAPWLAAAPVMLEGGAWVVQRGAASAVANRRPLWHYRTIAWLLALVAAGINLWHGMRAFDPATAMATAFASVAGPGVWDLHEHGRIRVRDGKLTRRQRREKRVEEKRIAAEKTAERQRAEAEKQAGENAAREAAEQLAAEREETYPKEWEHALALRAALGETTVTDAVWRRAWRDIHGADPGDTVDIIRGRNTAARRLAAAVSEAPGNRPVTASSSQAASQVPPTVKTRSYKPPVRPGRRTPGDTPTFAQGARNQASIAAKNATRRAPRED